jgi:hypothetical protein
MDCNHARLLLTFARDRADLDQSEADGLEEHLNQCAECQALSASERQVDAALAKAMNAVPTPPGLKERLLAKLPRPRVRLRRWIATTAAAAAVVLLALTFSWHVWPPAQEPDFDNVPIVLVSDNPQSPQEVEDWFERKNLTMTFPRQFDSGKLNAIYVADFQGRRVPKLVFLDRASGSAAHVYVLSDRQFNVDAELPSHLRTLKSMETYRQNGYLYLVIYTGSLDPFVR